MISRPSTQRSRRGALYSGLDGSGGPRRRLVTDSFLKKERKKTDNSRERREAGKAARARDRQAAVALQNEAEESGATEEEATGGRTTRVGRPE